MVLHLNKLQSPSPKDALCQVWLKLAKWFWRRFLNFVNVFSLFGYYLSLEKGGALSLNNLEYPSPMDALFQVGLKLVTFLSPSTCKTNRIAIFKCKITSLFE